MPDIKIARTDAPTGGRFVATVESVAGEGEMTFSRAGQSILIIDHTEVPPQFAGMGVGKALVARAVEDARRDNVKIIPFCPFAAATFRKHPEWRDVLKES